jgi:hypothetical protein
VKREFDYEIVNNRIAPIAEKLVKKYGELRHINVNDILFVVNHKTSGGKKRITLARTRKIPDKWRDLLFQSGSSTYNHMIEFIGKTTATLDENQIKALLYRELRMIDKEGGIVPPDTNDWWTVIAGLGRDWFYPDRSCPNLLDENIDWEKLEKSER